MKENKITSFLFHVHLFS